MGDKYCFAVGTVGCDVAVDVREVVPLVGGHYLLTVFAFGAETRKECKYERFIDGFSEDVFL